MNKRALRKDILIEVSKSKTRFISIMLMIALGSAVFVGLCVTGPTMRNTLFSYTEKYGLQDLSVSSPLGLALEDQVILSNLPGISQLDYGYRADFVIEDTDYVIAAESLGELPKYEGLSGRLPKAVKEIALESFMMDKGYKIGDTIKLKREKINNSYPLKYYTYTITGFINSPEYLIPSQKGSTSVGDGILDTFGVVTSNNFQMDNYTIARLNFADVATLDPYSEEYKDKMKAHADEIDYAFSHRPDIRLRQYQDDGLTKISDGNKEITDAENALLQADQELANAKIALAEGWSEYWKGKDTFEREIEVAKAELLAAEDLLFRSKAELSAGQSQLSYGERELSNSRQQILQSEAQLAQAERQLVDGERQLREAQREIEQGRLELETQKNQLNAGLQQINSGIMGLEIALSTATDPDQINYLRGQLSDLEARKQVILNSLPLIDAGKRELDEGQRKLDQEFAGYHEAKREYDTGKAKLAEGRREIRNGEAQLNAARFELSDGQVQYNAAMRELENARYTLETERIKGEQKLKDAYEELLKGEQEYRVGLWRLQQQKTEAQEEIEEGKADIDQAEKDLARLKVPKYTIHGMYDNSGLFQYVENSENMDFMSLIFPVFFFLIALLVCLTTMTRMVDEHRVLIGTYKALGYSDLDIAKKYLVYGSIASLAGSLLGVLAAYKIIMPVIFNAYSSSFLFKEALPLLPLRFSIMAVIISLLCTAYASLVTLRSSLDNNVATLLRPKAPKIGNRILLERIPFIWKHLSFTYKVTARNIFRYKKRMLMTIIGVAGCTALVFMGFGIKGSVHDIMLKQYGEIFLYDTIVLFDDEANAQDIRSYQDKLKKDDNIAQLNAVRFEQGIISIPNKLDQDISIVVPENEMTFRSMNVLQNRLTKEDIALNEGAVITERLAYLLKAKVGDSIEFRDNDDKLKTITITGIAENYVGHYMYLPIPYYEEIFNRDYKPNAHYISLHSNSTQSISDFSSEMLENDLVLRTVNTNTASDVVEDLMGSLDIVVIVIIALSSLLAIVVLYNLTNINVSERIRELCTIKVLGFYPEEVTTYVYRETTLLTLWKW